MTSLTQIAKYTRDAIKYGSVGLVLFVIAFIGFKTLQAYLESRRPAPPIIPTVEYGKLPPLTFPQEKARPSSLILQTIQGSVPEATPAARVYHIPPKTANLLAGKRASQFALDLKFSPSPVRKTAIEHQFADPQYPARSLTYDLARGNFNLVYDLTSDNAPLAGDYLPIDNNRAIEESVTLLQSLGKLDDSLTRGEKIVSYYQFVNGEYVIAPNRFDAQFVRVDFMPPAIDDVLIKTAQYQQSAVFVIFSGRRSEQERVVKLSYQHFPVNPFQFSTYPLKSSQSAWEELAGGGGYVVNVGEGNSVQAYLRDAFLAYYDPGVEQEYLQPIFVFTGDRGFEAYVPAVNPEWIE